MGPWISFSKHLVTLADGDSFYFICDIKSSLESYHSSRAITVGRANFSTKNTRNQHKWGADSGRRHQIHLSVHDRCLVSVLLGNEPTRT